MSREQPANRLGISTCLLGELRHDGRHKLVRYLWVRWVYSPSGCPSARKQRWGCHYLGKVCAWLAGRRILSTFDRAQTGTGHTVAMVAWARQRVEELADAGVHGCVFKKDAPQPLSCFWFSGADSSPPSSRWRRIPGWALVLDPRHVYNVHSLVQLWIMWWLCAT